jgi:hypothetical protein
VLSKAKIAICVAAVIAGAASAAVAKDQNMRRGQAAAALASARMPIEPYGTDAEVQQCVANMETSLRGRSVLGSRDTAAYFQDRANLDEMGLTEYDVMVGRCTTKFFHRWMRAHGRQP